MRTFRFTIENNDAWAVSCIRLWVKNINLFVYINFIV